MPSCPWLSPSLCRTPLRHGLCVYSQTWQWLPSDITFQLPLLSTFCSWWLRGKAESEKPDGWNALKASCLFYSTDGGALWPIPKMSRSIQNGFSYWKSCNLGHTNVPSSLVACDKSRLSGKKTHWTRKLHPCHQSLGCPGRCTLTRL